MSIKKERGEPCTLINILKATGYLFVIAPFKIVFYITGKMREAYRYMYLHIIG